MPVKKVEKEEELNVVGKSLPVIIIVVLIGLFALLGNGKETVVSVNDDQQNTALEQKEID